jgi:Dynein heavy chain, N-terminal region 1
LFISYTEPGTKVRLSVRSSSPTHVETDVEIKEPLPKEDESVSVATQPLTGGQGASDNIMQPAAGPGEDAGPDQASDDVTAANDAAMEDVQPHVDDADIHGERVPAGTLQVGDEAAGAAAHAPQLHLSTDSLHAASDQQASVYLVKQTQGALSAEALDEQLELGIFTEPDTLSIVSRLFEQLYIPILAANIPEPEQLVKTGTLSSSDDQTRVDTDLLAALQKFHTQVKTSATHLSGNIQLTVPEVEVLPSDEKDDDMLLLRLEEVLHEWSTTLQNVKAAESSKVATMDGPLDEIFFWNERNNVLGGLHEQVSLAAVQNIIQYAPMGRPRRTVCCL